MRIVTWNINGLRACLRRRFNGKLINLLNFLNADIICLQETKIATARVEPDLAFADGWESFFANCRIRGGYSGVATFCRAGTCMPFAALDGFSGVLPQTLAKPKDLPPSTPAQEALSNPCSDLFERFSQGELEKLDSEGRVIMTDHGAFVLVNVYGPAISTEDSAEERYAFKLQFYKALLARISALREAGRAVILLGDLNISLATIDSCDPGNVEEFNSRQDRRMLTMLLTHNGGPFLDTFRKFYPDRQEAYTCWSTASSARINNYGTRIDLILAAGPCGDAGREFHASVVGSDVWMDAYGSDHAPAYADLAPSLPIAVGSAPPPLSSRYLYTGKQGNLKSWLASASVSQPLATAQQATAACSVSVPAAAEPDSGAGCLKGLPKEASVSASVLGKRASAKIGNPKQKAAKQRGIAGQSSLKAFMRPQAVPQAEQTVPSGSISQVGGFTAEASLSSQVLTEPQQSQSQARSQPTSLEANQVLQRQDVFGTGMHESADLGGKGSHIRQLACSASSQPAVLREPQGSIERQGSDRASAENSVPMQSKRSCASSEADVDELIDAASRWDEVKDKEGVQAATSWQLHVEQDAPPQNASAKAAWKQIQQRMKPPLCKGHSEPSVIRQVKKGGPNQGRVFFVCRRAAGNLPEGRCDFFQWEGDRQIRGSKAPAGAKGVTLKGCWN